MTYQICSYHNHWWTHLEGCGAIPPPPPPKIFFQYYKITSKNFLKFSKSMRLALSNFSNIRFLPLNLPKFFKTKMVNTPPPPKNSSYFLYNVIKLVQFLYSLLFWLPIHKILVPHLAIIF